MEKAFSAWIGNLGAYAGGELRGEWISFPAGYGELEKALARIGGEEQAAFDFDIPEKYGFLRDVLGEHTSPREMNLLGHALQELVEERLEAVAAYTEVQGNLGVPELLNAMAQADEIPYYAYDFKGIESVPVMGKEEKYGYTVVEGEMPDLVSMLENYHIADYLDYAAIGRDGRLSGEVFLGEAGYLDMRAEGLDLSLYTMEELQEQYGGKEKADIAQEKGPGLKEKGPNL